MDGYSMASTKRGGEYLWYFVVVIFAFIIEDWENNNGGWNFSKCVEQCLHFEDHLQWKRAYEAQQEKAEIAGH